MKMFTNLLTSLILASWVATIAILSVQNASPVSLKFLTFQSIKLPAGVVLAFSAAAGVVAGAIAPLVWQLSASQQQFQPEDTHEYIEEDPESEDSQERW